MNDFLSLIETIRTGNGSDRDPGGGRRVRRVGDRTPQAFSEALGLVERVLSGDRYAALHFSEAMSTDDFPLLFGDIIDRSLVAAYQEYPADIMTIADQRRVRDFRTAKRFAIDGGEGQLEKVGQLSEYPEGKLSETADEFSVDKYGKRLGFSWEDFVNDDLDAFRDAPMRLGKGARRSEQKFLTGLYVDANGPHATLYTAAAGNIIVVGGTTNPTLTTDNLEGALTQLAQSTDEDGEPIFVGGAVLVVPIALESTARRILDTTEFRVTDGDGNVRTVSGNAVSRNLRLVVDPYYSTVATTNGDTSWHVFADPGEGRPALEFDHLIGHEQPEIWVRTADAQRIGGGTVGPDSGSFDTDSIDYRVRHVWGGGRRINTGGRKATVASNGTGVA